MFFDKNVLQEKYTNLRRHLDRRSLSEPDDGKILSTQNIFNINLIMKYFPAYICNSVHFEVPLKNSRLQSIVNIWVHKSLKFRRRKHHQVEMTEDCDEEEQRKCQWYTYWSRIFSTPVWFWIRSVIITYHIDSRKLIENWRDNAAIFSQLSYFKK